MIIILAVFPGLLFILYFGLEQRRWVMENAQKEALNLVNIAAGFQENQVEEAKNLLFVLSRLPRVNKFDSISCMTLFAELMEKHHEYLNIGVVDQKGNLLASALPFAVPITVADCAYFRRAMESRSFAVSDYQIGPVTGKPQIIIAYPLLDESGEAKGAIYAALSLSWLNHLASKVQLPDDSTITVVDRNGNILAHPLDPEKWLGRPMPNQEILRSIQAQGKGALVAPGFDGAPSLYAFTDLGETIRFGYVFIGIPAKIVFAPASKAMIRNLIVLGAVTIFALLSAWVFSYLFLTQRIKVLLKATHKLATGDLSARTGLIYGKGEIDQLARTFDDTAEILQKRETERLRTEEALRLSEKRFRDIAENAREWIWEVDVEGRYTYASPMVEELLGYKPEEVLTKHFYDLFHSDEREKLRDVGLAVFAAKQPFKEFPHPNLHKNGELIWLSTSGVPILDETGNLLGYRGADIDITARKKAEEALEQLLHQQELILNSVMEGIFVLDLEGNIIFANAPGTRMLGYEARELIGSNSYSICNNCRPNGSVNSEKECLLHMAVRGGIACFGINEASEDCCEKDEVFWRKDGTSFPVRYTVAPIVEFGKIIGSVVTFSDIAERKEADELSRNLIGTSPVGIYVIQDKKFQLSNHWFHTITGYGEKELSQIDPFNLVHSEDREKTRKNAVKMLKGKSSVPYEYRAVTKEGENRWIMETVAPLQWRGKRATLGYFMDITERKRTEEELKDSEQRFKSIFDNAADGFLLADLETKKFFLGNETIFKMLGYGPDELYQLGVPDIHPPQDLPYVLEQFAKLAGGEISLTQTPALPVRRKDGSVFYAEVNAFPLTLAGKSYLLGIFRDVTVRKKLEAQFLQAQKMEAVGRLAGGVAHDYNNMLTVINWHAGMASQELRKADPLQKHLEGIKEAADRAISLTNQLLAFSRKQKVQPQVLNLNTVVTAIESMLRRLIGEDIELVMGLDPALGNVKADPGQIEQVIMNLAVNAKDAMPRGGNLTIETANVCLDGAYLKKHMDVTPGPYVMLAMSDNGEGMDAKTKAQIFEPFFTTKESGKGTGLGLSTVFGIVKQGGGYIDVYSEPGGGTAFKIYLPLVEEAEKAGMVVATPLSKLQGWETILVVEDEDMLRELIVETLKMHGYKVLKASNGGEALLTCERHKGPIHLMLTDVVMPVVGGRELAERLAPLRPEMEVLYMSGYTEEAIIHQGVLESSELLIQKPFSPIALVRKLREVLGASHC